LYLLSVDDEVKEFVTGELHKYIQNCREGMRIGGNWRNLTD